MWGNTKTQQTIIDLSKDFDNALRDFNVRCTFIISTRALNPLVQMLALARGTRALDKIIEGNDKIRKGNDVVMEGNDHILQDVGEIR